MMSDFGVHCFVQRDSADSGEAAGSGGGAKAPVDSEGWSSSAAPFDGWSPPAADDALLSGRASLFAGLYDSPTPGADDVVPSSGGSVLSDDVRGEMESKLGADFGNVRIHLDNDRAASLGSEAYTVGNDIVFASDKFAPDTREGKQRLAHELTHVVQQSQGAVDGTDIGGGVAVSDPYDRFEQEAEAAGDRVAAGECVSIDAGKNSAEASSSVQRRTVQRKESLFNRGVGLAGKALDQGASMITDDEKKQALLQCGGQILQNSTPSSFTSGLGSSLRDFGGDVWNGFTQGQGLMDSLRAARDNQLNSDNPLAQTIAAATAGREGVDKAIADGKAGACVKTMNNLHSEANDMVKSEADRANKECTDQLTRSNVPDGPNNDVDMRTCLQKELSSGPVGTLMPLGTVDQAIDTYGAKAPAQAQSPEPAPIKLDGSPADPNPQLDREAAQAASEIAGAPEKTADEQQATDDINRVSGAETAEEQEERKKSEAEAQPETTQPTEATGGDAGE
jgi:hypothetical protein